MSDIYQPVDFPLGKVRALLTANDINLLNNNTLFFDHVYFLVLKLSENNMKLGWVIICVDRDKLKDIVSRIQIRKDIKFLEEDHYKNSARILHLTDEEMKERRNAYFSALDKSIEDAMKKLEAELSRTTNAFSLLKAITQI